MQAQQPQTGREDVGVGIAQISFDGKWLMADRCLCDLLGSSFDELSRTSFDDTFQILEPEKDKLDRARLLNGEIPYYASHRNAAHKTAGPFPARMVFSLSTDQANGAIILAVVEDLSELRSSEAALHEAETARRELARRLTTAQEKERTRIARELHDDIGQSLAILRIQMLRAGQPVSGMVGKRHPTILELCENLKTLTDKVSHLSRELHSSELEYLGLEIAIQSHCREFAQQYKIAVECSSEGIPKDLNGLLAVSLLRIVQEALHNAGKHSKAKTIQVAVHGSPSELSLLIADDGVGFDPDEAKLAAGLGLISMRERAHLADGDFKITTGPGEGTCISVRVPLGDAPNAN
jgi:signal transduction histidine kinase